MTRKDEERSALICVTRGAAFHFRRRLPSPRLGQKARIKTAPLFSLCSSYLTWLLLLLLRLLLPVLVLPELVLPELVLLARCLTPSDGLLRPPPVASGPHLRHQPTIFICYCAPSLPPQRKHASIFFFSSRQTLPEIKKERRKRSNNLL